MSRTSRATVIVNAALRQALINGQASMGAIGAAMATGNAMGTSATGLSAVRPMTAIGPMAAAGGTLAPVERRAVLAATTKAKLVAQGWTVTMVDGDADHYTGIEATLGDEHLLAAVGADDLITDQAGAHDCGATLDAILSGLRADGAEVTIIDDVAHDGRGGSLYSVVGGPTRAHAIAVTLRQKSQSEAASVKRRESHRRDPGPLRNTTGGC